MLDWHSVTSSSDTRFFVKGTVLSRAVVPDTLHRFVVVEIRCQDADGHPGRLYGLEDAYTVSDADVRDGKRPKIVARFRDLDAALAEARRLAAE